MCQDEVHQESEVPLPSSALQGSTWCENHDVEVPVEAGEVQWLEESVEEQEEAMESVQVCRCARDRRISCSRCSRCKDVLNWWNWRCWSSPLIWCIVTSRRISRIGVR